MISPGWVWPVRIAWLLLLALSIGLFAQGILVRVGELQQPCMAGPSVCHGRWLLTPEDMSRLQTAGAAPSLYAAVQTLKWVFFSALWTAVGAIIFARKSRELMAVVVAFFLMLFPTSWDGLLSGLARAAPIYAFPTQIISILTTLALPMFLSLFPDGRFAPRWTRWVALVAAANSLFPVVFPETTEALSGPQSIIAILSYLVLIGAQVIRYRRYSSREDRTRTRLVLFGLAASGIFLVAILSFLGGLLNFDDVFTNVASQITYQVALGMIPLSIGVAILRHRLFDIDIVIRRTVAYAIISAALAIIYLGANIVAQGIISALGGQRNEVAIVASTLAVAALFSPVRRRVQDAIDRRFNRQRYDADKIVADFAEYAARETDLAALQARIVGVVAETIQPKQVSLWVRQPIQDGPELTDRHSAF